ncbi:MAG: hypothetical protein NWF07_00965 [Candidatus Bathyarchaeota archaeon]|nr:hypothetical protein [Candidatus Bathyarchaeota archaeon]
MNRLVKHMIEHHHPGGNVVKIVRAKQLIEEGFTVEEIHNLTMEAYCEGLLVFSRDRIKGNRWSIEEMIPGDIQFIGIYGSVITQLEKNDDETTNYHCIS